MRVYNGTRRSDPIDTAFAGADSRTSEPRSAPIRLLSSSGRTGRERGSRARSGPVPPKSWNEAAELLTDIQGMPILVRLLIKDIPAEMQSGFFSAGNDLHSLLSSTLERMVDRVQVPALRNDTASKQPLITTELLSNGDALARPPVPPKATVLRVGALELDLLDRTAKRGERRIDLRPREFQLLKYMMQRSEQLLTRATMLKEVWRYRFVPETNLVDVHMGRLRRKVDASDEPPMIRNIRGLGFILNADPSSLRSSTKPAEPAGKSTLAHQIPRSVA